MAIKQADPTPSQSVGDTRESPEYIRAAFTISSLLFAGILGYSAIRYFAFRETAGVWSSLPGWLPIIAAGLLCISLVTAALIWGDSGGSVRIQWVQLLPFASAAAIGGALGMILVAPVLSREAVLAPFSRVGGQIYVLSDDEDQWRDVKVVKHPSITFIGSPGGSQANIQYSAAFRSEDDKPLRFLWRIVVPENAAIDTDCDELAQNARNGREDSVATTAAIGSVDRYFLCDSSPEIGVTLQGQSATSIWARTSWSTRNLSIQILSDKEPLEVNGSSFEQLSSLKQSYRSITAQSGQLITLDGPDVSMVSPHDSRSRWWWRDVSAGVAVPTGSGFTFPASMQPEMNTEIPTRAATMRNLGREQWAQIFRDMALLVLGGAVSFNILYQLRRKG